MNNHEYSQQYLQAMKKLHGSDKPNTCQHPKCSTIILKDKQFCLKHRGKTEIRSKRNVQK